MKDVCPGRFQKSVGLVCGGQIIFSLAFPSVDITDRCVLAKALHKRSFTKSAHNITENTIFFVNVVTSELGTGRLIASFPLWGFWSPVCILDNSRTCAIWAMEMSTHYIIQYYNIIKSRTETHSNLVISLSLPFTQLKPRAVRKYDW